MSAIKKLVDGKWKIFSATDAINISTVFPGYKSTTDATYKGGDAVYYWCYRSDKKVTSDVIPMICGTDYEVGDPVGIVYFKNPDTGEKETWSVDANTIFVNSAATVHDVLKKHDDDIALLKRNVSWLALHGGGGGGGGGGGSQTKARCTIYVNNYQSPGSGGYIVKQNGDISIKLDNFNIETNKAWTVSVYCDTTKILTTSLSWTTKSYTLSYDAIKTYEKNYKIKNFKVYASYEDDDNNIYGSEVWEGDIVIANVSLSTPKSTYNIEYDFKHQATIMFNYTSGVLYDIDNPDSGLLEYTIRMDIVSGSLTSGAAYFEDSFKLSTEGSGFKEYTMERILENCTAHVPPSDQLAGDYAITATLYTDTYIGGTLTRLISNSISFNVILLQDQLVYVSKYLSTIQDTPTVVSSDSQLNVKYFAFKNNKTSFLASYYIVAIDETGQKIGDPIHTIAIDKPETIGELISYSFSTSQWKSRYIDGETLAFLTVIDTVEYYTYFRLVKGNSDYLDYSDTGIANLFTQFMASDYGSRENDDINSFTVTTTGSYMIESGTVPVDGDFIIPNVNDRTWIVTDETTGQPSLRLSNGVYGYMRNFYVNDSHESSEHSVTPQTFKSTVNYKDGWSISLCYKCDYHPDDNRTIMSCGTYDNNTNHLQSGFSINAHSVCIGQNEICNLTDSTVNCVDITYTKSVIDKSGNNIGLFKIYVNGTLTAVCQATNDNVALGDEIYFGGRPAVAYTDDQFLADCNIYSFRLFTKTLGDLDILTNYINNKIFTSYHIPEGSESAVVDDTIKGDQLFKNLCYLPIDPVTGKEINQLRCHIYNEDNDSTQSTYTISNFLDGDTGNLSASSLAGNYHLGVPVVLVDVSAGDGAWSFETYSETTRSDDDSALTKKDATCQYWDKNRPTEVFTFSVDVKEQGTSTRKLPVKNIDITLKTKSSGLSKDGSIEGTSDFFIPRADWLPEQTYTIKVDMVDSAHSNNATIGTFINKIVGYDANGNCKLFPADDKAVDAVYHTTYTSQDGKTYNYHQNQQNQSTLKHTVDGFPIFLIMKFYEAKAGGEAGSVTIPIGIASFNLGRKAYRNLGFNSLLYIKNNTDEQLVPNCTNGNNPDYPILIIDGLYKEQCHDAEWIETKTYHTNTGMSEINRSSASKDNGYPETFYNTTIGADQNVKYDADFWQCDDTIIQNYSFESQYDCKNGSITEKGTINQDFRAFAEVIAKLPIEGLNYSQQIGCITDTYISGKYQKLVCEGKESVWRGAYQNIELVQDNYGNTDNFTFDHEKMYYYFVLALFFGLLDNFGKNVSYRRWNNIAKSGSTQDLGKYYTDFYDLDTALGLTNQGEETVGSDIWFKYLDNYHPVLDEIEADYGYATECYYESNSKHKRTNTCSSNVVSSYDNKLWLTIDSKFFRTLMKDSSHNYSSNYTYYWNKVRRHFDSILNDYNLRNPKNTYDNFADYFVDQYFTKQTGDCGPMIFNFDYRIKYLGQARVTDTTINTSMMKYIHGRRSDYVRKWLKDHILFLDSIFAWRDSNNSYATKAQDRNYRKDTENTVTFTCSDAQDLSYPVVTNTSMLINGKVANNIDTTYWMKKNQETLTNCKFSTQKGSSIPVEFNNSSSIIRIGDDSIPLSNLHVASIGFSNKSKDTTIGYNGLPSLTLLNFTGASSFVDNPELLTFAQGPISELRKIDFSNTKDNPTKISIDLSLKKYDKVNSIDISNSKVSSLNLPPSPLYHLQVHNSLITAFALSNQRYLNNVSLQGCDNLQTIEINKCYNYDKLVLSSAHNLTSVKVSNCKNFKILELTDCDILNNVDISNCPSLEVVRIINAKSLVNNNHGSGLKLNNIGGLIELNVQDCVNLNYIEFSGDTGIDVGSKLRTLNISNTKINVIRGICNGTALEETYNSKSLLDLVHFPNLSYNDPANPRIEDGKTITETFSCYWNQEVEQIRFANNKDTPIKITRQFTSDSKLCRVYGSVILCGTATVPPIGGGTSSGGTFAYCPNFSIHGINTSKWNGKDIKDGNRVQTSWELAAQKSGKKNAEKPWLGYNKITLNDVFVATDTANSGFVTNMQFGNCSGIMQRTFQNTKVTQFDAYYTLMMVALSNCVASTTSSLYATFYNDNNKLFNWTNDNNTTDSRNEYDRYTFFKLGGKISGAESIAVSNYTYLYSPTVAEYTDDYKQGRHYKVGDIIYNNGTQKICKKEISSAPATITGDFVSIGTFDSSKSYFYGDVVKYNNKLYICKYDMMSESGIKAGFSDSNWKEIIRNSFYVYRDDGVLSPLVNSDIMRPFSSAVYSKWIFRRLSGKYADPDPRLNTKLVVDIDRGYIYDDDGIDRGYVDFTNPSTYTKLTEWGSSNAVANCTATLPITKTVTIDEEEGTEWFIVKNTGNYDGFFDDFNNITKLYWFGGYTLNYDKLVIPKSVDTIGSNAGWGCFNTTICRGSIDFSKLFPAGNSLVTLNDAFVCNYYHKDFSSHSDSVNGRALMIIDEHLFDTLKNLMYYGWTNVGTYDSYTNCFCGSGIKKKFRDNLSLVDIEAIQQKILDPIAANIVVLSGLFRELESTNTFQIPFPGKLFIRPNENKYTNYFKQLKDIHNFMTNCQQPYYLTSEGFARCSNLESIYEMCYYTLDGYGNKPSSLNGVIPYRFLYQGYSEELKTVYGSNNIDKPTTSRISDSISNFTKNILKLSDSKATIIAGDLESDGFRRKTIHCDKVKGLTYKNPSTAETKDYFSDISIINNCNVKIDDIDTEYNGNGSVILRKAHTEDTEYDHAEIIIKDNVITKSFDDSNSFDIVVTNACQQDSYYCVTYTSKIVMAARCFTGCNNIQKYEYKENSEYPITEIVSTKNKDSDGEYVKYNKPFVIKTKDDAGNLIDTTCGMLETNPDYNKFRWYYDTSNDSWFENKVGTLRHDPWIAYWSWCGNPDIIKVKRDTNSATSTESLIYDNSEEFSKYGFLETLDIIDVKDSNKNIENVLNYCCCPDLLRYFRNDSSLKSGAVSGLFYNCGSYGVNVNYGMKGRICPYLLKPVSTITSIADMFRNCRTLSSYKYGRNRFVPVYEGHESETLQYSSDTVYYIDKLVNGQMLPTKMDSNIDNPDHPDYTIGTNIPKTGSTISVYKTEEDSEKTYQIPDTFFSYAKNVTDIHGAFSGLIFLFNTKLDVFSDIQTKLRNICDVYAACHYIVDNEKVWTIQSTFSIIPTLNYASAAFSLAYFDFNTSKSYYVNDPGNESATCYLWNVGGSNSFKRHGDDGGPDPTKLVFANNFKPSLNSKDKIKYTWWGFHNNVSVSENSGVNTSKG